MPLAMVEPVDAQGGISVQLDCDSQTVEINVHPEQNTPTAVGCTVKNTGSGRESITVDYELSANDFSLTLSETTFELDAGEESVFLATFNAQARMEVTEVDFDIIAQVNSVVFISDPAVIPVGLLNITDNVGGTVKSLPYSRVDLDISDRTTRNIESGDEFSFLFTIYNDGNRLDTLEAFVVNADELEEAGFAFITDPFFREDVQPSSSSAQGTITLQTPSDLKSNKEVSVVIRAFSKLDESAEVSEVTIKVVVESSSGGGLGGGSLDLGGFDTMSQDSVAMIAMAGGGLFALILLLVIISKLSKKTGQKKTAAKAAKKSAKAAIKSSKRSKKKKAMPVVEEIEDDFDFGDLDDDLDDFDFDDL
ncbi:MAG: hypothetical protein CXT71_02240 [Methanobacteriota archaeon]|nr:MAG: hypothetical protein CXT71_02240 [Euryarchaeota archaeon]